MHTWLWIVIVVVAVQLTRAGAMLAWSHKRISEAETDRGPGRLSPRRGDVRR